MNKLENLLGGVQGVHGGLRDIRNFRTFMIAPPCHTVSPVFADVFGCLYGSSP